MYKPTLIEWNWHILMLNQAMVGAISNNFRMITLKWENGGWVVEVTLFEKSQEDEEEANEITDQLAIFIMDVAEHISESAKTKILTRVVTSDKPLLVHTKDNERIVFKKKD